MQKNTNTKNIIIPKKTNYNSEQKLFQFQIGDGVLLSTKNLAIQWPRKLAAYFVGPFHIIRRIGP